MIGLFIVVFLCYGVWVWGCCSGVVMNMLFWDNLLIGFDGLFKWEVVCDWEYVVWIFRFMVGIVWVWGVGWFCICFLVVFDIGVCKLFLLMFMKILLLWLVFVIYEGFVKLDEFIGEFVVIFEWLMVGYFIVLFWLIIGWNVCDEKILFLLIVCRVCKLGFFFCCWNLLVFCFNFVIFLLLILERYIILYLFLFFLIILGFVLFGFLFVGIGI